MKLWKARTIIKGDFSFVNSLVYRNHTDYDLKGVVDAISVKSATGSVYDFYRDSLLENPINFKYTKLYHQFKVKKLIDFFELEKTRIRIHRQLPTYQTKLHVDEQNTEVKTKEDIRLRIFTALTSSKDFIYEFKSGKDYCIHSLKQGESLVFDPDEVEHGTKNLSKTEIRYSLVQIVKPNDWLKSFINNKQEIML